MIGGRERGWRGRVCKCCHLEHFRHGLKVSQLLLVLESMLQLGEGGMEGGKRGGSEG